MKTSEFIRKKNKIIKKYTGIDLVPEDQIKDVDFNSKMNMAYDSSCCPYCAFGCKVCPMVLGNNRCGLEDSTYTKVTLNYYRISDPNAPWHNELKALVNEWNEDIEKEKKEAMMKKYRGVATIIVDLGEMTEKDVKGLYKTTNKKEK